MSNGNFISVEELTGGSAKALDRAPQIPAHHEFWREWERLSTENGPVDVHAEFEPGVDEPPDELSRRRFLQLAAASLSLAGVTGCTRQPVEHILPYVEQPENVVPGNPKYYATALPMAGMVQGIVVESHLGRPTKIEGNRLHPASLGAASVHAQASVLDLYDPDRSRNVSHLGLEQSRDAFLEAWQVALAPITARHGAGLRVLSGTVVSPTLGAQFDAMQKALPEARWHQFEPAASQGARDGAILAFGRPVNTIYRFDKAAVVVSLDCDFLATGDGWVRYAHDFSTRRAGGDRHDMNRLYVVESTMTPTGGKADHRLTMRYADVDACTRTLAAAVGVTGVSAAGPEKHGSWISAAAADLRAHSGSTIVIPGPHQCAAVHALAHAMNAALGNVGKTVLYSDPVEVTPVDQLASLHALAADMASGQVEMLLILGGNPVYSAPADIAFGPLLSHVKTTVHVGLHEDETADLCQWHVPETHFLEDWGDVRSFDGTVTILQPLIQPLYDSQSASQTLDLLFQTPARSSYEMVRAYWQQHAGAADFEAWWRRAVHDGVVADSALPAVSPALRGDWSALPPPLQADGIEIVFRPDAYLYDGRFANNAWLQELPQSMSKLVWDNAVHLSAKTAHDLGLKNQDRVDVALAGHHVEGSVWISPGQPDQSVTVRLGWGRWRAGRAGDGAGFNAYRLRRSDAMWVSAGLQLHKLDKPYPLATTQTQQTMEGRDLVLAATVERYKREPGFAKKEANEPEADETLYPKWNYPGNAWGMSIDMTRCVNCSACVVACQSENNIPVVGKEQALNHRAMHWLRIDTYYKGEPENPEGYYQPVPCMQCEDAPCELVCPVQATNHSTDGLNDMVYNRCVGTRYCSNNCPYKVRRFNFLLYQDWTTESLKLQRNPDVSVRSRGVMEKCTYCVQRIRETEIHARVHDTPILDGQIQTACQQSCPTQAIVFGNINDKGSRVARLKGEILNYSLLAELNTRPRTTYLAELRNPNPRLESTTKPGSEA